MMRTNLIVVSLLLACLGCRGGVSKSPPIHIVQDMDDDYSLEAQAEFAEFPNWEDKRTMRLPVEGTVARGTLATKALGRFQNAAGGFLDNPLAATLENFERGRERYDIYCAVCHDRVGSGKGLVMERAPQGSFNPVMPDLATEPRLREMKDGELYQTITNGKGTMPAYGHMVPVEDRWRIVHYLRALQNRID